MRGYPLMVHIDLTSPDGYDIVIDGFDLPIQNRDESITQLLPSQAVTIATVVILLYPSIITFQNGDVVRVNLDASETETGLFYG